MIVLYDYYRSSASYRVRIALHLKQLQYEKKTIHLVQNGGEQHFESYAKLNPLHLVPTLKMNGETLTQSLAIIDYLEYCHPSPSLYPACPILKSHAKSLSLLVACDIHPLNNLRVSQYLKSEGYSNTQWLKWYHHWLKSGFDAIESMLISLCDSTPFALGDKPGIVDCVLVPQVYNAERFNFSLDAYPRIQSINKHCLSHPAFITASP